MKKTFPILLAALGVSAATTVHAGDIGNEALGFLETRWPAENSVRQLGVPRTEVRALDGGATLVNVSKGSLRGFVIYAGDRSTVIGYSPEASLDCSDIPLQLAGLLRAYPAVEPGVSYPVPENLRPVEPIIKTHWHQLAPFNCKCPLYHGEASAAGCTAIALAQVLNHYRPSSFGNYSIEYKDSRSGAEISVDYSKSSYDWANIRQDYAPGSYTHAEADAVGKLVFEAGAASLCEYSTEKSSGKWALVALLRYFNFKADFYMREYLPTAYWMDLLFSEISAGRPVIYGGSGYQYENHGMAAHEFIVDGVDAEGLFHVNWGWGGKADGYYDITFCKTSDSYLLSEGYSSKQLMICGISPRTPQDEPYREDFIVTSGTEIYSDRIRSRGLTSNFYTFEDTEIERDIVAVNEKTGEFLSEPVGEGSASPGIFPAWSQVTSTFPTSHVKPGKYLWKLASRRKGEAAWRLKDLPMQPWISFDAEGRLDRGYLDYSGAIEWDNGPRFTLDRFEPLTEISAGASFFATIRARCIDYPALTAQGYSGNATLAFRNTETGKVYVADGSPVTYDLNYNNLYSVQVIQLKNIANPDNKFSIPAGHYEVYVSTWNGEPDSDWVTDGEFTVDVNEKKNYPLLQFGGNANSGKDEMNQPKYLTGWLGSETLNQEAPAEMTLFESGWNYLTTANDVYGQSTMNVYLCPSDESTLENEVLAGTFSADMLNQAVRSTIPLADNLYPLSGYCRLYVRYMTPEGERDVLPGDWKYVDPDTGLGRVPTEVYISAPAVPTLPRIQVSDLSLTASDISFIAKNLASETFLGVMDITVLDRKTGRTEIRTMENVDLAAGASARFSAPFEGTATDLAFRVRKLPDSCSAEMPATYATRNDGRAACFRVSDISSVPVGPDATADEEEFTERFYNLQGIPVEHPRSGEKYIRVKGREAVKIYMR